jgi:ribonuclease HII
VSADFLEQLNDYPWYRDVDSHRILADRTDVAIAASVLQDDLALNELKLLELKSYCLEVSYYNKMISAVRNKAGVLFTAVCSLIKNAVDNFSTDELHIIIDRQGGRMRYRRPLLRMFPDMHLKILKETPTVSSYELQQPGHGARGTGDVIRLHFAVDADDRFLPVSLASMLSKFIRQLLIENINRYFISFHAELKPTAGYWKDGLRFIEDLKRNIPHVAFDSNRLIRCR